MKILYIFPHPDDESFGPAGAMFNQRKHGHEVYLLTLTKGGATKQRYKFGYSIEQMDEVRYREMLDVEKVLNLSGMTVLDMPDSGLKELDPRIIEEAVRKEIEKVQPNVVVTYAVHGISGFHDHLISHATVKRVYCELNENSHYLKRLAFYTISEEDAKKVTYFHLNGSKDEEIDCTVLIDDEDIQKMSYALDCYKSYEDTIENSGIKKLYTNKTYFEIFKESHNPKLNDLFDKL
jgi:LmbE family N-acetylglucosaminyl deacetylase